MNSRWVATEWGAAWVLSKRIVPILYGCNPNDLPSRLIKTHAYELYDIDRTIEAFRRRNESISEFPARVKEENPIVDWHTLLQYVKTIADAIKMDQWRPEVLLAFPKGGLIVADLLDHHFDCNIDIVSIFTKRPWIEEQRRVEYIIRAPYTNLGALKNRRVLIVDDVLENGFTLLKVMEKLVDTGLPESNIKTAVLGSTEFKNESIGIDPVIIPDYHAFRYTKASGLYLPWGEVTL